jgi:hypothetical protein
MPWRKTRSAIRTSCCLIHPDFHPKPAITEGLQILPCSKSIGSNRENFENDNTDERSNGIATFSGANRRNVEDQTAQTNGRFMELAYSIQQPLRPRAATFPFDPNATSKLLKAGSGWASRSKGRRCSTSSNGQCPTRRRMLAVRRSGSAEWTQCRT